MNKFIQQYRGRGEDAPRDNMLAEYARMVGSSEYLIEIQHWLKDCGYPGRA